jgi:hypothetical protein
MCRVMIRWSMTKEVEEGYEQEDAEGEIRMQET